jgi:flagellar biosynthesis anti-sigma factor FlgM
MKIEANSPAVSQLTANRGPRQVSTGGQSDIQGATEDRTTFHSDPTSVQSLTSQALNSPEIRQNKVDALRQSVGNGEYQIDPTKIAEAFIASNSE